MNTIYDILTETYRPDTLNQIIGQSNTVNTIKNYIETKSIPHLLFSGSPGTGKTTMAIVIAKELYKDEWSLNFKEINSSDERGIETVRTIIKDYVSLKSTCEQIPYKILLLDECDATTTDFQNALRRLMETYSGSCRFILSCNNISKIIPPLISRCQYFRFSRISNKDMIDRLKYISDIEKINISNEGIEAISFIAEGDLRKSINLLESARSSINNNKETQIQVSNIYKIANMILPEISEQILKKALINRDFFSSYLIIENLLIDGYHPTDILKSILNNLNNLSIEEQSIKLDIVQNIAETEFRIVEGSNEYIQMKGLIAKLIQTGIPKIIV